VNNGGGKKKVVEQCWGKKQLESKLRRGGGRVVKGRFRWYIKGRKDHGGWSCWGGRKPGGAEKKWEKKRGTCIGIRKIVCGVQEQRK